MIALCERMRISEKNANTSARIPFEPASSSDLTIGRGCGENGSKEPGTAEGGCPPLRIRPMPARASDIRLIISDVDGVWTDGRIIYVGRATRSQQPNHAGTTG